MCSDTGEYAELHCLSNFSFGRGASSARELFARAKACGYQALAITDECSLAGIVRAWEAARDAKMKLIVGAEIRLRDGPKMVLLCEDKAGYTALCRLITRGRRASKKGEYKLSRADFEDDMPGVLALWLPEEAPDPGPGRWIKNVFGDRAWIAVELHRGPDDAKRLQDLQRIGKELDMPLVASGDVHMHVRARLPLQHTLTAFRHRTTIAQAGPLLFRNGERHLRKRAELAALYPRELLDETLRIAARCTLDLKQAVQYRYPAELVPVGHTPATWLRELTGRGIRWRWPQGAPEKVCAQIEHELELIAFKEYEAFFLTVHDIVRFARAQGILCQGRGSAANSAVCYVLGITEVDPEHGNLLMERFISRERDEPPDIDVDFEHERREEVIQYIYGKYGRERAALAATVISYRGKSAARGVGKAMGLSPEQVDQLSRAVGWWDGASALDQRLRERGFDPDSPLLRRVLALTAQLLDMPRHLSQHVGGFVVSDAPLSELVPVENAAMADRTIIQWDKDDLDSMGLLKVDCLALGMLTCIRKCFDLLKQHGCGDCTIAGIRKDDPPTYAMVQRADTIGVFQIESRAQMSMLPRLKPKEFYDLVIQVAIVRPGPIQGDMVHPYLRRRRGEEPVTYPSEETKAVLERTLGVPLFQEQVMRLMMVAAGYTPGEADRLRRDMAAWKRRGGMEKHEDRIRAGMLARGYTPEFAERTFNQIKGFGSYGFPESHAASFAILAWASSWLKCHHPAAFACALLNSQPMGFYAPSQIAQDAQRHGVRVLPVDVRHSDWDCTLEADRHGVLAIRLGLREVRGCSEKVAEALMAARAQRAFADVADLCARASLDLRHRTLLAQAGALRGLAGHRHRAQWAAIGVEAHRPLFDHRSPDEAAMRLPLPSVAEDVHADYARTGLTLGPHPLKLLRARLRARHWLDSKQLQALPHESEVRLAGLVTQRQRPQTASGVTFITLEDEHGPVNVIVWRDVAARQWRPYLEAKLLGVQGRWE
ncbi:MAG TPA: error-prone DNA polymerase, partial [Rhodanobacteraceae bacterium]|nr:error-prone DNA polymerase [Rhodanobacteraceae bacterium]